MAPETADPELPADRPLGPESPTIFRRAVALGADRLTNRPALTAMNGVLAGIYICFSGLGALTLYATVKPGVGEHAAWAIGALLFPLGFLFVTVGRGELFTETFLAPVLAARERRTWGALTRLWVVTIAANLVGILLMAALWSQKAVGLLPDHVLAAFAAHAEAQLALSPVALFARAIFAGVLVTLMVWLAIAGESPMAEIAFIVLPTYLLMLLRLAHSMTGSFDVLVGAFVNGEGLARYATVWLPIVVLGNLLGGVLLVALLHYGQHALHRARRAA